MVRRKEVKTSPPLLVPEYGNLAGSLRGLPASPLSFPLTKKNGGSLKIRFRAYAPE